MCTLARAQLGEFIAAIDRGVEPVSDGSLLLSTFSFGPMQ